MPGAGAAGQRVKGGRLRDLQNLDDGSLARAMENAVLMAKLAAPARPAATFAQTYGDDPVAFVHDCLDWERLAAGRPHMQPAPYQEDILTRISRHPRVAACGPRGLGKSSLAAWTTLWYALTREGMEGDWKNPCTASGWNQLTEYFWPEVHKWARYLRWEKIGRSPFKLADEMQTLSLKLRRGEAFAIASDNPAKMEGAHADRLLYMMDEAKIILAATWDSIEGAFSTGNRPGHEARQLAVSSPGPESGRFWEIVTRQAGYEDWDVRNVTLDEAVAAGRIDATWVEQRAKQWGADSTLFMNQALGLFATADDEAVIPSAWVELAEMRWKLWDREGRPDLGPAKAIGVDVARFGGDDSGYAVRYGDCIVSLDMFGHEDTMQTAKRTEAYIDTHNCRAIVDVLNAGAGVVDRLREDGYGEMVLAFNASGKSERKDSSGELGYQNLRAEAWWTFREAMMPGSGRSIMLPANKRLRTDLTAPGYDTSRQGGGRIQIEDKRAIRNRIGHSPDPADAVVQAFFEPFVKRKYTFRAVPQYRAAGGWTPRLKMGVRR